MMTLKVAIQLAPNGLPDCESLTGLYGAMRRNLMATTLGNVLRR
jgi:hypothetical protein